MNFFLVFSKSRKKFDKFIKNNRIKNKVIIDVSKIVAEEEINLDSPKDYVYFKVLIYKILLTAQEKNKNVYYLPWIKNEINISKLLNLKKIELIEDFNLLLFHKDLENEYWMKDIIDNVNDFTNVQILEDY